MSIYRSMQQAIIQLTRRRPKIIQTLYFVDTCEFTCLQQTTTYLSKKFIFLRHTSTNYIIDFFRTINKNVFICWHNDLSVG